MKRIIGILGLLAVVGCGDVATTPIEEVQSSLLNAVAPARPYGNLIPGNVPGWVTIGAPGGEMPFRPNLGYPGWNGGGLQFYIPPSMCHGVGTLCSYDRLGDPTYGQTGQAIPSNRVGFGYVYFWNWDKRWPFGSQWGVNGWANAIPLRSPTVPTTDPHYGPAYQINDLATTHMQEPNVGQFILMVMDYYARVTLCSGPNLTGNCIQYGYNCALIGGICHGDVAGGDPSGQFTTIDLTSQAAAGVSGPLNPFNPHPSMKVEYGF